MTKRLSLKINERHVTHEVSARTHLGDFLREKENLTGTHLGCEHGVCGACVVLLDGQPVRSCITYAVACEGKSVTTIEGYDNDPVMTRLRIAFSTHHALQCGYCTPGMLATARDIVLRIPNASERVVRAELSGNLCRCTGYVGIVEAILAVLEDLRNNPDSSVDKLRCHRDSLNESNLASQSTLVSTPFKNFDAISASTEQVRVPEHDQNKSFIPQTIKPQQSGTEILESFDLPFSATEVWTLMIDLPSIARCLPGAYVTSVEDGHVKGGISLKFGPMQAAFEGLASLTKDETNKTAILNGTGQDRLSQSRASGTISYRIESIGNQSSRVHIDMTYGLQGPLAQFSRSGMVKDFVRRMIKLFAENIKHSLINPGSELSNNQKNLHPIGLFFGIIWDRLRALFSIKSQP